MLRAGPAAPAESDPAATRATSCRARCGVYGLTRTWSSARAPAALAALWRPAGHEPPGGAGVAGHRFWRGGGIAPGDGLGGAAMVPVRGAVAAGRVGGSL